jgi:lysophospholipase L1-like esterase
MSPIVHPALALLAGLALLLSSPLRAQDAAPVDAEKHQGVIKLACVGDSITQGVGAGGGQSWPDQIRKLLGDRWEVKNFGVSATTLLNAGDKPYQKEGAFKNAKDFAPDVVVIMLGTNDTKPQNWKHKESFTADYQDMIGKFAELPSRPRVFICYPPYIAGNGNFGINEANTKAEFPLIDAAAKATKAGIIDVHAALDGKDALIPDKVHPNAEGAGEIAKAVFRALTGKAAAAAAK